MEDYIAQLFDGRKGHGNSIGITRRVLRPVDLRTILRDVYQRGFDDGRGGKGRIELK